MSKKKEPNKEHFIINGESEQELCVSCLVLSCLLKIHYTVQPFWKESWWLYEFSMDSSLDVDKDEQQKHWQEFQSVFKTGFSDDNYLEGIKDRL